MRIDHHFNTQDGCPHVVKDPTLMWTQDGHHKMTNRGVQLGNLGIQGSAVGRNSGLQGRTVRGDQACRGRQLGGNRLTREYLGINLTEIRPKQAVGPSPRGP